LAEAEEILGWGEIAKGPVWSVVDAHRTERRDVLYPIHPWSGRDVFLDGATDKTNGVFRCTLDGSGIARSLEIPVWMFDRAVCVSEVRFAVDAFVDLEALGALSALLDQVLKTEAPSSNTRLRDAYGASRDENRGESHGAEDDGVSDRGAAQTLPRIPTDGSVYRPARAAAPPPGLSPILCDVAPVD
jgi:hypothetical protein